MKVAIVGPDGAGKTTVIKAMLACYENSICVYGGKRDFKLGITKIALWGWRVSKRFHVPILSQYIRFFIYYPIEYVDNLFRLNSRTSPRIVFIERHPVDRMVLLYEYLAKNANHGFGILFSAYPCLLFWFFVYRYFSPTKVDHFFFLMPKTELGFVRADGQYRDMDEYRIKLGAYCKIAQILKADGSNVHILKIDVDKTVQLVCKEIMEIIV